MARIRIDVNKLKNYLREEFEMNFSSSRTWDDLPECIQQHWTKIAEEMSYDLITKGIVEITE
jgi:hypothetical protein